MAEDLARLGLEVDSGPIRGARQEMGRFAAEGKKTEKAAGGVTKSAAAMSAGMRRASSAIGAAVAGLAALSGSIQVLSSFERQMSAVGAVSRATADEMAAMRSIAAELGSTTEFTATQAGEGLEFLARGGFSASESISAIPAILDLATAAAMGLGNAADISSNIMSAFGIAATDAASVADVLAAASSRANTDVEQLGTAMSFVGPVASALEIEMSDAAAAIGVLSDAGIQGSSAGTGLRRVLSSLANPTGEAKTALEGLGLELERLNPQTNDITEIVQRLSNAGLSAADALTIFGDRGGPAILALTSQTGRLRELTGALTDVEGESARMADTMRNNLGGDIDSLWSSVQGLIIALGDAGLTAVLRGVIGTVTAVTRGVTAMVNAFADAAQWFEDLFDFSGSLDAVSRAADTANLAIADNLAQVEALGIAARGGQRVSLDYAGSLLATAKAARATARAERALALQRIRATDDYQRTVDDVNRLNEAIGLYQEILSDSASEADIARLAKQFNLPINAGNVDGLIDNYQRAIDKLREIVDEQEAMLDVAGGTTEESRAATAQIELLEQAIKDAKDGVVTLGGATSGAADTTQSLVRLAGMVSFDSATQSASLLAAQIGVNVDEAVALNRALNNAAGIQNPEQPRLSLPGGAPEGSIPGSFTGAGGELGFDLNNTGPNPADFRPDRTAISSRGGGGGSSAASKIDQEREAIDGVVDSLKDQIAAIGETSTARKTAQALRQAGVSLYSKEGQQIADLVEQYAEMQEAQRINEDISRSLKDAILDFALEGTDALDGMTKAFQRMAIEAALFGEGMMGNGGGGLIGGLVDSAAGALSGLLGGSASAGPLAGQPIFDIASSFDGGGYTGSGARTGGLDGRGGFMAMMHPRERVYDESRGQSRGQQGGVVNNIKVIAPPGSEVSEERQQNSSGGEDLTVMIDRAVSSTRPRS